MKFRLLTLCILSSLMPGHQAFANDCDVRKFLHEVAPGYRHYFESDLKLPDDWTISKFNRTFTEFEGTTDFGYERIAASAEAPDGGIVELGHLDYLVKRDTLDIDFITVEDEFQRQGISAQLYSDVIKSHPQIQKIHRSALAGTNQKIFKEELVKKLHLEPDFESLNHGNLKPSTWNDPYNSCKNYIVNLNGRDPARFRKLVDEAFAETPGYRSLKKLGFDKFCNSTLLYTSPTEPFSFNTPFTLCK